MEKLIITVIGRDRVGILAQVCSYLARSGVNILDISQTITGGYFNMMMVADASSSPRDFGRLAADLAKIGVKLGLQVGCQKAEIFEKMHRV